MHGERGLLFETPLREQVSQALPTFTGRAFALCMTLLYHTPEAVACHVHTSSMNNLAAPVWGLSA